MLDKDLSVFQDFTLSAIVVNFIWIIDAFYHQFILNISAVCKL